LTEYLTEQEQLERLKQLVKQYGPAVVFGLLVAFIFTFGWHKWQDYQNRVRVEASIAYENLLTDVQKKDSAATDRDAANLVKEYGRTPYATLARFIQAREALDQGDSSRASTALVQAMHKSADRGLREIARLRLARLRASEGKGDEALALLNDVENPAFSGLRDTIRGDVLLLQKNLAGAREAYDLAFRELPAESGILKTLVQMKYDSLGTNKVKETG